MGFCINDATAFAIFILIVIVVHYIIHRPVVKQPIYIKSHCKPIHVKNEKHFQSDFPIGKYMYQHLDQGTVGYLIHPTTLATSPLMVKRQYNKYYYYTNINDIRMELDKNPVYTELQDDDMVSIDNIPNYRVKLYRTDF